MVEQVYILDSIFGSLSDPTRRDILQRLGRNDMSVGEVAGHYKISLAAVAKHLNVLERAGLIKKTRRGKEQIASLDPAALAAADEYLESYRKLWEKRLDSLEDYINSVNKGDSHGA